MENENDVVLYRSSDIYFCSYLQSLDLQLERTEPEEDGGKRKIIFVFKVPIKDLPRLKASYFGGTGTVKIRKYVDSLRNLKSLCYI